MSQAPGRVSFCDLVKSTYLAYLSDLLFVGLASVPLALTRNPEIVFSIAPLLVIAALVLRHRSNRLRSVDDRLMRFAALADPWTFEYQERLSFSLLRPSSDNLQFFMGGLLTKLYAEEIRRRRNILRALVGALLVITSLCYHLSFPNSVFRYIGAGLSSVCLILVLWRLVRLSRTMEYLGHYGDSSRRRAAGRKRDRKESANPASAADA